MKDVPTQQIAKESEPGKATKRVGWKTFFMLLIMVIAGPLGNVMLSKGMKQIGAIPMWPASALLHDGTAIFGSLFIWMGIASLITFFVSYMLVLSWADYSFVQPASSVAYGVVALLGYTMLGERVSPLRWAGIAVICLGVFVVTRTGLQTVPHEMEGQQ